MKKYIVAEQTGGLQESPELRYSRYDIIEANNEKEGRDIYNKKHNCYYFYGETIGEVIDSIVVLGKWYKTKIISENIDAKLYAKIETDYSCTEDYHSWYTDLVIEYDENDKTLEYLENGYTLVGYYDSKTEELRVNLKNISVIDCIANYRKRPYQFQKRKVIVLKKLK